MGFEKYYEAREILARIMQEDLLGPVKKDEIICDERPLDYYILGKLYPQDSSANDVSVSSSEDCGELDEEAGISLSNSKNPSSFGISFSLNAGINRFIVHINAAKYSIISREDAQKALGFEDGKYRKKAVFWRRNELNPDDFLIDVSTYKQGHIEQKTVCENLSLRIVVHKTYRDGTKTISVTLVNENTSPKERDLALECVDSFFQPSIKVLAVEPNTFSDVRRNKHIAVNNEVKELEMLYSRIGDYASGHGCAVNWDEEDGEIKSIYTEFMPDYEVLQMMPSTRFRSDYLQMKKLGESSKNEVINELKKLTEKYGEWIDSIENNAKELEDMHKDPAAINIRKCRETCAVLNKSINCLNDDLIFKAFALANKAMFLQREQMLLNTNKYKSDDSIKWYPFQLAFFLQEIVSFADPNGEERKKVDLLWFSTGGGKTEAYLGIAAFVIFLRRLKYGDNGDGVTILMRYTLRLLSFQQFERASALICACEVIRKKEKIKGGEIGIGLWAGMALTPNNITDARKILNGEKIEKAESSNPVQIKKCPWCGKPISEHNYHCNTEKKRMTICCNNPSCDFHTGLPIYLIDEEIYEYTPTFIVATIDKFAQVALNENTSSLFGKSKNKRPPELIIQDELHLISGPLGTITGLYEAAIRKLCEHNNIVPKIIASTATIKNAKEQISSLYASDYTQFPPQGIDINDSFFAEISKREDRPARMYLGCMGIGTSPTTMMIRVLTSLLFASRYLAELDYDERIIDSFWTITGYFNTLRELGGAIIRVVDDIQDRFNYLRKSKFVEKYPIKKDISRYDYYKELTSREKSENIGTVIQKELTVEYKADNSTHPYDFLLSSNMISVGVDVGRLGTMVVVGQPKTTSEYIQATSRVGRETPGLVIATYNQSKSRDRSHYEDFTQYHGTFYRYVEATSVTPFSDRARDRALQALYVILCRNLIDELAANTDAVNFRRTIPELSDIKKYIFDYVERVDPSELEHVKQDIEEIELEWEERCIRREKFKYKKGEYESQDNALFQPDYCENGRFRILNTMRSVETSVKVSTNERKD